MKYKYGEAVCVGLDYAITFGVVIEGIERHMKDGETITYKVEVPNSVITGWIEVKQNQLAEIDDGSAWSDQGCLIRDHPSKAWAQIRSEELTKPDADESVTPQPVKIVPDLVADKLDL